MEGAPTYGLLTPVLILLSPGNLVPVRLAPFSRLLLLPSFLSGQYIY